jgi:hypothetical protein
MIDGFRVDVTAEELAAHLDERVHHHQTREEECAAKLRRLEALDAEPAEEEEAMFDMCASSRVHGLERMLARHRSRVTFLAFARDHIVAREIYRLSEEDLRLLEWLPAEEPGVVMARM